MLLCFLPLIYFSLFASGATQQDFQEESSFDQGKKLSLMKFKTAFNSLKVTMVQQRIASLNQRNLNVALEEFGYDVQIFIKYFPDIKDRMPVMRNELSIDLNFEAAFIAYFMAFRPQSFPVDQVIPKLVELFENCNYTSSELDFNKVVELFENMSKESGFKRFWSPIQIRQLWNKRRDMIQSKIEILEPKLSDPSQKELRDLIKQNKVPIPILERIHLLLHTLGERCDEYVYYKSLKHQYVLDLFLNQSPDYEVLYRAIWGDKDADVKIGMKVVNKMQTEGTTIFSRYLNNPNFPNVSFDLKVVSGLVFHQIIKSSSEIYL